MATTFYKIESVIVGSGGASSIAFNSIPNTYTDLCVKLSLRSTRTTGNANVLMVKANGTSSGNYFRTLIGDGSTASSFNQTALFTDNFFGGYANQDNNTSNAFSSHDIYLPNYAGSITKSASADSVTENNGTTALASIIANLWSDTAAITSLSFSLLDSHNFKQYSTATLYGIKNS